LGAKAAAASRRARKQALTSSCSSRWAGAITRTSDDAWGLAERNLAAEARSLQARTDRIQSCLAVAVGGRRGRARGYASAADHFAKRGRLQSLQARPAQVEARLQVGQVSVCRGGRRLART